METMIRVDWLYLILFGLGFAGGAIFMYMLRNIWDGRN